MKKIFIPIIILFSYSLTSQTNDKNIACSWTGSGDGTTWSSAANWTSCDSSYPSGDNAQATIGADVASNNRTITIDQNISLRQMKIGGSYSSPDWVFESESGETNTITFTGGDSNNSVYEIIQYNRGNVTLTFNANVTFNHGNSGEKRVRLGTNSHNDNAMTFGGTLTLTHNLQFQFNKVGHSVTFNGPIVMANAAKVLRLLDYHTVTFGTNVDMSNFSGNLYFNVGNGAYTGGNAGSITVNGDVKAKNIRLAASDMTINTTGSITATNGSAGNNVLSTDGTGKIILKTSKTNSGSIIANNDTGGYKLDFVRTLDSDNEITFLGIPVTDESIQDVITNHSLRTGSGSNDGKSFLGYFDNSSSTYTYYATSGNSGNLGTGSNSGGKSLTSATGFIISPSGSGSTDITISGSTTNEDTNGSFTVYRASGTYGAYHLVGNPYPAYVALNANADGTAANNFLQTNETILDDSYEQIWAWDGSQWNTYNLTENTVKHIAPGEGFFIRLPSTLGTDTAGAVLFNESMKKTGSFRNFNAQSATKGSKSQNIAIIKIKVTDLETNQSDKVKLYFSDNSTKGLDKGYDGGKFFIKNSAYMYTRLLEGDQGVDMDIQALPYSDLKDVIIPIGVETESSSIEFSFIERDLSDLYNIFLEDRLNNTIVKFDNKLKIDLENKVNGHNRFFLHFTDGLIPELPTDNDLRIFKNSSSNLSIIGNPNQRYKAKIFDYSGRLVKEAEFIHKSNIDELDSRMKILRIESKDGLTVKKFKLN